MQQKQPVQQQKPSAHKQHLNKLYNQDAVVEDSEKTSSCYLKTLALQFLIVTFTIITVTACLMEYFDYNKILSSEKLRSLILTFTLLTMLTVIFQKLSIINWIQEKKDFERNPKHQYIYMIMEILILLPIPNNYLLKGQTFVIDDQANNPVVFFIDDLLIAYVCLRFIYFLKFLIHFELYYGSRPDRLSRLYTVKFGTFNAFKFLINQKPQIILMVIFILNYLFLPLILMLVESKVNPKLTTFIACLYYEVVTQVTVGYGDIVVVTIIGRVICVFSILIGITTTSMLLIFFMRLMEQNTHEEESHALLGGLEKKKLMTIARVQRLEAQWNYRNKRIPEEERQENLEKLNEFRFANARRIRYQSEEPPNLKRMMMGNFAALVESLNALKETEIMLSKYIKIIENSKKIDLNKQGQLKVQRQRSKTDLQAKILGNIRSTSRLRS